MSAIQAKSSSLSVKEKELKSAVTNSPGDSQKKETTKTVDDFELHKKSLNNGKRSMKSSKRYPPVGERLLARSEMSRALLIAEYFI